MPASFYTNIQKMQMIAEYLEGETADIVGKRYGVSRTTICRTLRVQGFEARSDVECQRTHKLDVSVFDNLAQEARYWIGFLLSDGCIHGVTKKTAIISLALCRKDAGHVAKWRDFLKSDYRIELTPKSARLAFRSLELANRLAVFGIVPRKTGRECPPDVLKNDRDFWRGMIDGDGTITHLNTPWPTVSICGSRAACQGFIDFCLGHISTKASPTKIRGKNCWHVSLRGSGARAIAYILYNGATISLDRKQVRADLIGSAAA